EIREVRRQRLMELQAVVSERRLRRFVGRDIEVLVDARVRDAEGNVGLLARSPADAPEIDGRVILDATPGLRVGEFARVRIGDSAAHDLYGEVAGLRGCCGRSSATTRGPARRRPECRLSRAGRGSRPGRCG